MKICNLLVVLCVICMSRLALAHPGHGYEQDLRLWAHADHGADVSASFVLARNGRALLCKADDSLVWVNLSDLSEVDRAWISDRQALTAQVNNLLESPNTGDPAKVTTSPVHADPLEIPQKVSARPTSPIAAAAVFGLFALAGVAGMLRKKVAILPVAGALSVAWCCGLIAFGKEAAATPEMAKAFAPFKDHVSTRWDDKWLYVDSDGMPSHNMMVGITAWQQQVPLPKAYTGANAWQIPLHPVPAKNPVSIKGKFLRGAIAVAVNGIPIFNPQNNRGEVSQEIGELDEWGGHCGRGDDYHYHAAPIHLEKIVGKGRPIAFALDGYPIYGTAGPDGQPVDERMLDPFHGKTDRQGNYAYFASTKYPYLNGGFHGEVTEVEGQVDPQPTGRGIRPALPPLRGAKITGFTRSKDDKQFSLKYDVNGQNRFVNYVINADGSVKFEFVDGPGQVRTESYSAHGQGGAPGPGRDRPRRNDSNRPPKAAPPADEPPAPQQGAAAAKLETGFQLRSPVVSAGGALPREFTGDGESATPPLEWSGAPAQTKSYALIMHHIPGPGEVKWYWIVYNIPPDVHSLAKNVQGVGVLGNNSVNRRQAYAPPHSKGPGKKTYILTLYALSAQPKITVAPEQVNRAALLEAMKGSILASAELPVTYDRTDLVGKTGDARGATGEPARDNPPRPDNRPDNRPVDGAPPGPGGAIHLFPREVEEKLNLTAEQRDRLDALQRETEQNLMKILTPEQATILSTQRPPPSPRDR